MWWHFRTLELTDIDVCRQRKKNTQNRTPWNINANKKQTHLKHAILWNAKRQKGKSSMIWQSRRSPKNKLVLIIHPCTTTLRFVVFSLSFVYPPLFLTCLWHSSISRGEFHSRLSRLWVCYQATAECKGLTKADSVQATWVGSLTMWNRERVVTANYWTTPAPEIKATASHERTGLGLEAVGAWKERLGGWRMSGWKRGQVRFEVTEAERSGGKHVWLFGGCQKFEAS